MALTAAELLVRVGADTDEAEDKLNAFGPKMKSIMGGIALGAVAVVGVVAAGLTAIVVSGMGDAREAIAISKQTAAVIKSTGGVAGMTSRSVAELQTKLSTMTNFEDDAIQAGENLLLTFTNIGGEVFPQATETILDMSQALGQDLKSSAMQLGKALNDPVEGLAALGRVGVQFTADQEAMIKSMVEAGDVMGAQKVILAELNREFGGQAVVAADPITQATNAWNNFKEAVATALIPTLNQLATSALPLVLSATEQVGPAFDKILVFAQNLRAAYTAISGAQKGGRGNAIEAMNAYLTLPSSWQTNIDKINAAIDSVQAIARNLKNAYDFFAGMQTGDMMKAITAFQALPKSWQNMADTVNLAVITPVVDAIKTFIASVTSLATVPAFIAKFQSGDILGALAVWETIPAKLKPVAETLNTFISTMQKAGTLSALKVLQPIIPAPKAVMPLLNVGEAFAKIPWASFGATISNSIADELATEDWHGFGVKIGEGFATWWANFKFQLGGPLESPNVILATARAQNLQRTVEARQSAEITPDSGLTEAWNRIGEEYFKRTTEIWDGITEGITGKVTPNVQRAEEVMGDLGDTSGGLTDTLKGLWNSFLDGLKQAPLLSTGVGGLADAASPATRSLATMNEEMASWDRAMIVAGSNMAMAREQLQANVAGALGDMAARPGIPSIPVVIPPFQRPAVPTIAVDVPHFQEPAKDAEPPPWVTDLLGWSESLTTPPPWVATLTTWAEGLSVAPPWIATLAAATAILVATTPPWIPQLAGLIVSLSTTPDWVNVVSALVTRLFTTPPWVGSFRGAVDRLDSAPGWLGTFNSIVDKMIGWSPSVGGNAGGTSSWRGGLTWVGERGPELINLNRGAQVFDARTSAAMAGGVNIVIQAGGWSDSQAESLAIRVAKIIARRS